MNSIEPNEPLLVRTPVHAVSVWAAYHRREGEVPSRRALPSLDAAPRLVGVPIPQSVATFVEETDGFEEMEDELRRSVGLPPRGHALASWEWPRLTIERFMDRLAARLPFEFLPPHEELCEAELDEILLAREKARLAAIDAKYKARYPGMMR